MRAAPIAIAALVRLGAWTLIPGARFASDEQGYVNAGVQLATTGQQDLFWPPMTGWIVALFKTLMPSLSLAAIRMAWIGADLVNVALVGVIAQRIATRLPPSQRSRFVAAATLGYALYLPAISHAQFVTSEIPALLLVLLSVVLVMSPAAGTAPLVGAGITLGVLTLVRANLAPLIVLLPAAAFAAEARAAWIRKTAIIALVALVLPVGVVTWNGWRYGEATLSRNAAYNLYIGNRDFYAEDLDLFHPRATPQQIEFRRQMFAGTLEYPTGTAAELQAAATRWIAEHPVEFARRALGRLARVFAPKTDVLELAGGETAVGVFSVRGLALLGVANIQWLVIALAGWLGLALLLQRDRTTATVFIAAIAGSAVLCLVAIAKPRYSFVFDPLLIVSAALALTASIDERAGAWARSRRVLIPIYAFLAWGWIAWVVFALTSRL